MASIGKAYQPFNGSHSPLKGDAKDELTSVRGFPLPRRCANALDETVTSAVRFAGIWIGLFAVTAGLGTIAARSANPTTNAGAASPEDNAEFERRLDAMPTHTPLLASHAPAELVASFGEYMQLHDAGIRRCRAMLMNRVGESHVVFEVSAIPVVDGTNIRLDGIELERATAVVPRDVAICFREELATYRLALPPTAPAKTRVPFRFCFSHLELQPKEN